MEKVVIALLVFVVLSSAKRMQWSFVGKGKNKKTHIGTQLAAYSAKSLNRCATDCAFRQYCQSVSYNFGTQECLLQSVRSDHHHQLLTVEEPGFSIFDMTPPLEQNEAKPVSLCTLLNVTCQNNGTCIDGPGVDYTCNCTDGFNGTYCCTCYKSEVFKSQNCTTTGPSLLLIGGRHPPTGAIKNTMELYDINEPTNSRILTKTLNVPLKGRVSVLIKNRTVVIVAGETSGSTLLKDTQFFDLHLNQFSTGPQLHEGVAYAAGAVVSNTVYICGGNSVTGPRKKCEKMDLNDSPLQWVYIASMNKERSSVTMVEHNGYLYAIGGWDFSQTYLSSMERYDPNADSWQMMASMNEVRLGCGATVLNGMIYVCGGRANGGVKTNTCERYEPGTDQWFPLAAMIKVRYKFMMATLDGKLFALGNVWGTFNTVEWYDPTADKWTLTQSLKTGRGGLSGVVLI